MDKEIEHWVVPEHGRGRLRPFLPGTSGNPKGRASGTSFAEVVRLARRNSVEAMQVLIDIALDPQEDARSRIVACQAILDRAFGKVSDKPPPVDTGDPVTLDANRLTDKELKALLKLLDSGRLSEALTPAQGDEDGESGGNEEAATPAPVALAQVRDAEGE